MFLLPSFCHFVSFDWEMVVDSLRGTFTSDGDEVEKSSSGLFCILLLWSVFIAVPGSKENICLQTGILCLPS